jgi:AcrR family transcriptional regulator
MTSLDIPPSRQRLNRATVIDMAAAIADAEGIDAVTLSRIAHDAGVKQPALYKHVAGIDELWMLLSLRARDLLVAHLNQAIEGHTRDAAVLAIAQAWRKFVHTHPGLYSATDRVPSIGEPAIESSLARVVAVLTSALDGYSLTDAQRAHCARTLRSSLHGFCVLEKDQGHPEPHVLDTSLKNLVLVLCNGIAALEL